MLLLRAKTMGGDMYLRKNGEMEGDMMSAKDGDVGWKVMDEVGWIGRVGCAVT